MFERRLPSSVFDGKADKFFQYMSCENYTFKKISHKNRVYDKILKSPLVVDSLSKSSISCAQMCCSPALSLPPQSERQFFGQSQKMSSLLVWPMRNLCLFESLKAQAQYLGTVIQIIKISYPMAILILISKTSISFTKKCCIFDI